MESAAGWQAGWRAGWLAGWRARRLRGGHIVGKTLRAAAASHSQISKALELEAANTAVESEPGEAHVECLL